MHKMLNIFPGLFEAKFYFFPTTNVMPEYTYKEYKHELLLFCIVYVYNSYCISKFLRKKLAELNY